MIILLHIMLIFADNYEVAYEYYMNGLNYYRNAQYDLAQIFFEQALQLSPRLESEIPEIKMYLGLSAFHNKDYATAKIYLQPLKGIPIVDEALSVIESTSQQSELLDTSNLKINNTQPLEEEQQNFNLLTFFTIMLIIFAISLAASFFTVFLIRRHVTFEKRENELNNMETLTNINKVETQGIKYKTIDQFNEPYIKNVWQVSSPLKKLIGITSNEDPSLEEAIVSKDQKDGKLSEIEDLENKLDKDINDILKESSLEEIEEILNELEGNGDKSRVQEPATLEEESNGKNQEAYSHLENVIKPDSEIKNNFSSIMKKEEKELLFEDDLDVGLFDITKELETKKISQNNIQKFFHKLFYDVNKDKI
ncbi:tetratricopeptide repeat protein [Petrotoga mobilis]|uniref:tetratricopeptide repeat protein n=1 Tax=Petrotoga mobilis TaxID=69499 RepID=UPI0012DD34A8|nr:tetratricopeptide repeat protein [Petrotoga mobilis]